MMSVRGSGEGIGLRLYVSEWGAGPVRVAAFAGRSSVAVAADRVLVPPTAPALDRASGVWRCRSVGECVQVRHLKIIQGSKGAGHERKL